MAGDITDPGQHKIDPVREKGGNEGTENLPEPGKFQSEMDKTQGAQKPDAPSPMDIANQHKIPSTPPTLESVQNQAHSVSSSLGDIKNQLQTKNLKLKNHEKTLISKKLKNANQHMSAAAKNLGADSEDLDAKLYKSRNPVEKFLSMVSSGQHQMVAAADTIKNLNSSGESVDPGKLLLVQIKLNKAQQLLTYTSTILGNATGMLKTLMNIQI